MFRSYDHHQAEKYIATLGLLNDTQQNIGDNNNVRYYETTDPLSIE
jgi:hypothetical protein